MSEPCPGSAFEEHRDEFGVAGDPTRMFCNTKFAMSASRASSVVIRRHNCAVATENMEPAGALSAKWMRATSAANSGEETDLLRFTGWCATMDGAVMLCGSPFDARLLMRTALTLTRAGYRHAKLSVIKEQSTAALVIHCGDAAASVVALRVTGDVLALIRGTWPEGA